MTPQEEQERLRYLQLKQKAAQGAAAPTDAGVPDQVVNEAIPEIKWQDRALVKNFAANDDEGFNYLQKQYPGLNFKKVDGDIVARKPGEVAYKKLDPTGFTSPTELLQDIGDIAYDIPAGIASGAATAASGLAGAGAGGVGAIPAAMAGGAASSAGLEALRQKIGQWAGVNQGPMDTGNVALAGGLGAAAPLLLGTGASGAAIAKEGLKRAGIGATEEAVQAATKQVAQSQRGIPSLIKSAVAPRIGQAMSGVEAPIISRAANSLDEIKNADVTGRSQIFDELTNEFQGAFDTRRADFGKKLGESKAGLTQKIDLTETQGELQKLIAGYEEKAARLKTPKAQEELAYIKQTIEDRIPKDLVTDPQSAFDIKGALTDVGNVAKSKAAPFDKKLASLSQVDKDLERVSRIAASKLDKKISSTSPELKKLSQEYAAILQDGEKLNKYFSSPEQAEATLQRLLTKNKDVTRRELLELAQKYGVNLGEESQKNVMLATFSRPSMDVMSLGGTTSTTRSVPLGGLGGLIGYGIGSQMESGGGRVLGQGIGQYVGSKIGSPAALRKAMELNAAAVKQSQRGNILGQSAPAAGAAVWRQMYQNRR